MGAGSHIPASAACGQWETLLADAQDGLLRAEDEATFSSHMAGCARCAEMFDEARRGREWLNFLSDAPEVPEGLVDRILARTGHWPGSGHKTGQAAIADGAIAGGVGAMPLFPAWQRPGFMGYVRRFAEPRLAMTAAMAFFSIALTLNLAGVKLTHLRLADARPAAVRAPAVVRSFVERRLTTASVPIVRYYDHLRLVYEVESSMRELRNDAEGEDQNEDDRPQQAEPGGPGTSRQNYNGGRNYNGGQDRGGQDWDGHDRKDGDGPVGVPQQSEISAPQVFTDYLETSLSVQGLFKIRTGTLPGAPANVRLAGEPTHSGGCALSARERNSIWTA